MSDTGQGTGTAWGDAAPRELHLAAGLAGALVDEASVAGDEEVCGLLVGRRETDQSRVARTVACTNAAPEGRRQTRFEIDPRCLIEEERVARGSGEEVVGFYHSHPAGDPIPSPVDRTYMGLWPGMVWVIVGARASAMRGRVRAWSFDPGREVVPREVRIESARGESGMAERPITRDP
ncbi:MAG: M67 family metallopeptidase [Gammaproteobacteria bacterium]|nr:M67 family metallopeptidase [Gammaproteobacteria bacterium]MDE0247368.1 M67 family metallopeptidase [Gammaproteobacteria bacterium]